MKYEELSDFEINKAVAEALGHKVVREKMFYPAVLISTGDKIGATSKNYCNCAQQAWPIITENGISIGEFFSSVGVDDREWRALPRRVVGNKDRWSYGNKNPLRAAMIVFLRMQEV